MRPSLQAMHFNIRFKLLVLFLLVSLLPLMGLAGVFHYSLSKLGKGLAETMKQELTSRNEELLKALVQDQFKVVRLKRRILESALAEQAREVERRLSQSPLRRPGTSLFQARSLSKGYLPPGSTTLMHRSENLPRTKLESLQVSYVHQAMYLERESDAAAAERQVEQLASLDEAYISIHASAPKLILWQHTTLESGVHTVYPGHDRFPAGYEPRRQDWYRQIKEEGSQAWVLAGDPVTGSVSLLLGRPVENAQGEFAGVTAINIPFASILEGVSLPKQWDEKATRMLVQYNPEGPPGQKLRILVHKGYQAFGDLWRSGPGTISHLNPDFPEEFEKVLQDVAQGRAGVRHATYGGREMLFAYGPGKPKEPFPVIIIPFKLLQQDTSLVWSFFDEQTVYWLQLTGGFIVLTAALAVLLAVVLARSVTTPVMQLLGAARRMVQGDHQTQVAIRSGDELENLGNIFNQIGPKLEEREKIKHSLALAQEVQQYLLPKEAPKLRGLDISGVSLYSEETGGDYYDYISLNEARLGIAVGDVTGHGVGAALLVASARGALRTHATHNSLGSTDLMAILNRHLCRDTGEAQFLTLFYGVMESEGRRFSWVSAGHDPGLLYRNADGSIDEMPNTGIPLGIDPDAEFGLKGPVQLQLGDIIVLGTDGIWEARNPRGEMFGQERLRRLIRDNAGKTSKELCQTVVKAVRRFRGSDSLRDDLTLVIIKAQPEHR